MFAGACVYVGCVFACMHAWVVVCSRSLILNPNCEGHLSDFDPAAHRHTFREEGGEGVCVCVCVHNTGCETVFVCCRINFGIHTVFMWTWLLLWRCWPLAEGIHIHSGTLAMHSLHNTHSFYSQREPRVCPLAPGQADLWPLKTPGHSCKTSAGKRRRQDNVNPRAAVNI